MRGRQLGSRSNVWKHVGTAASLRSFAESCHRPGGKSGCSGSVPQEGQSKHCSNRARGGGHSERAGCVPKAGEELLRCVGRSAAPDSEAMAEKFDLQYRDLKKKLFAAAEVMLSKQLSCINDVVDYTRRMTVAEQLEAIAVIEHVAEYCSILK
eukprot:1449526-Amphidinium_carterae.1